MGMDVFRRGLRRGIGAVLLLAVSGSGGADPCDGSQGTHCYSFEGWRPNAADVQFLPANHPDRVFHDWFSEWLDGCRGVPYIAPSGEAADITWLLENRVIGSGNPDDCVPPSWDEISMDTSIGQLQWEFLQFFRNGITTCFQTTWSPTGDFLCLRYDRSDQQADVGFRVHTFTQLDDIGNGGGGSAATCPVHETGDDSTWVLVDNGQEYFDFEIEMVTEDPDAHGYPLKVCHNLCTYGRTNDYIWGGSSDPAEEGAISYTYGGEGTGCVTGTGGEVWQDPTVPGVGDAATGAGGELCVEGGVIVPCEPEGIFEDFIERITAPGTIVGSVQNISIPSGTGGCPSLEMDLGDLGYHVENRYCDVLEDNRDPIKWFMRVAWILLGILIILSA